MSTYYNKFESEYFAKMFEVSANGQWDDWLEFCLNGAIEQANDSIARCHRFHKLKENFHEKLMAASPTPRSLALADFLFKEPIVRIVGIQEHFKTHYQTAQADIEKLAEVGILRQLSGRRPKTFYAPEIMFTAYGDSP
jgi:Fic family protein